MNKPIAITPILARGGRQAAKAPEGSAASGKALGEIACLSPEDALQRLSSTAAGLTPDQVEARLRSAGLNQVAHQARHTILGELVGRSINPLNLLLLSLAAASYFLGDQRAAIVIAVMVVLSISLGFIQEHRSNNAADKLQRMVSITATVRRQTGAEAHDHDRSPDRAAGARRYRPAVGGRHDPRRPQTDLGEGSLPQPVDAHRRGDAA